MNQKGFINIAIIVLVVVLVGVTGYFFLAKKSTTPTELANTTDTQSSQTAPSSINNMPPQTSRPTETADWKTYRSDAFGVVFKYPLLFNIVESNGRLRIDTEHTKQYGSQTKYVSLEFVEQGLSGIGLEGAAPLFFTSFAKQGFKFRATKIGKNNAIDAAQVIEPSGASSFWIFRSDPVSDSQKIYRAAFAISDTLIQHRDFLQQEGVYEHYRTQFDGILQSLELSFSEVTISDEDLRSFKLPIASFISEQEARTIINQRGFNVSTSGTIIKLKPANQLFFQAYTGPGSPIRIAGQYWEIRIPITNMDTECKSTQVLFVDATTGEFYNLGTSTSCN